MDVAKYNRGHNGTEDYSCRTEIRRSISKQSDGAKRHYGV